MKVVADSRIQGLAHAFAPCVAGLCLVGCAGLAGLSNPETPMSPFLDPLMSMQSAKGAVVVGTSTMAEVRAALGPAVVVKFDSGYEVWVYRTRGVDVSARAATTAATANQAEFVILFAPSGHVKKTRIRPANVTVSRRNHPDATAQLIV